MKLADLAEMAGCPEDEPMFPWLLQNGLIRVRDGRVEPVTPLMTADRVQLWRLQNFRYLIPAPRDTAHALWREGRDRVAIAGALLDVAEAMTGEPCPDAAIEILAPLDGRDVATAAVLAAMRVLYS